MMKKYFLLFAGLAVLACNKTDDDLTPTGPDPDPDADVTVQDFMWQALNLWYFWQPDAPNLGDNRFGTSTEYTAYLNSFDNPGSFFYNTCYRHEEVVGSENAVDRFSFFSDDYTELTQNLAGISKSNGLEFGLSIYNDNDDILGYVRYIVNDSDASTKDITRGEIFIGVDGQTLNLSNYRELLFGSNDTYTLNMATLSGGSVSLNGKDVTLTKQEGLVENPVFITDVIEMEGQKIGYLMYNGFTNEFDEDLNNAFGTLLAEGVTDLVLDLRYNSGGSVNSSRLLSSMIYGTFTDQVYLQQRWNPFIQQAFTRDDPDALKDFFASNTGAGSSINTLNLDRVYIITTRGTASASELVINGLRPYMPVFLVGTTTTGKNEFSLTMVDDPQRDGAPFIYSPNRENFINPDNAWAIQPLVGRNENSVGFSDYTSGFAPDFPLSEDLENLGVLGNPNEPLLALALSEITGTSSKRSFDVGQPVRLVTHSKMFTPTRDNMYLDKEINIQVNSKF